MLIRRLAPACAVLVLVPALALAQDEDRPARLDAAVQAAARQGFQGVVLVAQRGQVLLEKGYGLANEAARTPFSPTTLVQIGSNVKDFTKTAIYQLVEQGRIALSDSLPKFFRDVPADKRGITVQQLLTHRAGLPLGAGGGDDAALTRDSMLRATWALRLESAPGTAERYSNLGYSLLAAIIEQASGQPYDRYVADHIFRPAGMTETGAFLPRFDRARIAHGYARGQDNGIILDKPHDDVGFLYQLRGNGGYLSTVRDMWHFYQALRGSQLLNDPQHRHAVFNEDGPNVMAGSDLVSFFAFANFPGAGVEIFVATNHAEYKGDRLIDQLLPALGIQAPPAGQRREMAGGPDRSMLTPLQDHLPDTGPGRTVSTWLEAFNNPDSTVMRRFLETQAGIPNAPPIETRMERYRAMVGNFGHLRMHGWRPGDGPAIVVIAESDQGDTVTLTFLVEDQAPNRLMGIRVEVG